MLLVSSLVRSACKAHRLSTEKFVGRAQLLGSEKVLAGVFVLPDLIPKYRKKKERMSLFPRKVKEVTTIKQ